jgi:hypothetical protein
MLAWRSPPPITVAQAVRTSVGGTGSHVLYWLAAAFRARLPVGDGWQKDGPDRDVHQGRGRRTYLLDQSLIALSALFAPLGFRPAAFLASENRTSCSDSRPFGLLDSLCCGRRLNTRALAKRVGLPSLDRTSVATTAAAVFTWDLKRRGLVQLFDHADNACRLPGWFGAAQAIEQLGKGVLTGDKSLFFLDPNPWFSAYKSALLVDWWSEMPRDASRKEVLRS